MAGYSGTKEDLAFAVAVEAAVANVAQKVVAEIAVPLLAAVGTPGHVESTEIAEGVVAPLAGTQAFV